MLLFSHMKHSNSKGRAPVLLGAAFLLVIIVAGFVWWSHAGHGRVSTNPVITEQQLMGKWEMVHDNGEGGPMPADEHVVAEFRADGSYAEYNNGVLQGYELSKSATSSAVWSIVDTTKEPTIPVPGGETESTVGKTVLKLVFPNETDYYFVTFDANGVLSLEGWVSGYLDRYTRIHS